MANSVFLYDSGMKVRWRRKGQRIIFWAFGKPWIWRGSFLSIPTRTKIFVTEGETDAVTLLDLRAERDDPAKLVVATPAVRMISTLLQPMRSSGPLPDKAASRRASWRWAPGSDLSQCADPLHKNGILLEGLVDVSPAN